MAFRRGVGFTDIVKRPTSRAADLRKNEFEHGRKALVGKVTRFGPGLVITYKAAAEAIFGRFGGNGFVPGLELGGSRVFVMPGPMESNTTALPTLVELEEFERSRARGEAGGYIWTEQTFAAAGATRAAAQCPQSAREEGKLYASRRMRGGPKAGPSQAGADPPESAAGRVAQSGGPAA